ncbi:pimeloyl-CoA dehydrogenase large subunit protein (plasmid) [Rhizobium gallicum]|uniref:Pimeloyl-CoA dehydrogenase large subunit protein n=1 Tax=Rhizobium gallicum TaxID=56730 RepID=A0A1L5NPG9_9HYPH|nr:acyl-CoA dehydrogenase family protein [Rhizobium gallicum]APO69805.1 pimeloyl-CoA dehydrogenase large subunit protein [Rhizobium gallicum]
MSIDFAFNDEVETFRDNVAATLKEALPPAIRSQVADERIDLSPEDQALWQSKLHSLGWGGLSLPAKHGGPGWTNEQYFVFLRELGRVDAPRPPLYSVKMVAPTLLRFGSPEQVQRYVPEISSGNKFWCLGFSEPNSGSDLASMKCPATKVDGGFEITGSKIWISDAHHADLMCGFFRTDSKGRKQEGITALVVDMKSPGITVRPLPNYEGTHECNEVFFDKVMVPESNLISLEGNGWEVVKYLLTVERFDLAEVPRSIATMARIRERINTIETQWGSTDHVKELTARFARLEIDMRALAATECRFALGVPAEEATGAEPSILKWIGTELQQDLLELLMDAYGEHAQAGLPAEIAAGRETRPVEGGYAGRAFHRYRVTTIYGGSTEIQKELIARTALGLRT